MASQRQIAANRRNGAKSRGPRTQEGKARSRMNALRHGLAAVSVDTTTEAATKPLYADDSSLNSIYQRQRQIEVERVKVLKDIHDSLTSQDFDKLYTNMSRLAALERYSQRSYSKLKKYLV